MFANFSKKATRKRGLAKQLLSGKFAMKPCKSKLSEIFVLSTFLLIVKGVRK